MQYPMYPFFTHYDTIYNHVTNTAAQSYGFLNSVNVNGQVYLNSKQNKMQMNYKANKNKTYPPNFGGLAPEPGNEK